MRSRPFVARLALALMVALSSTGLGQTRQTDLETPAGKFPLYVTAEYLGMAGLKTVIRVRLRAPELSMAAAKRGLTSVSGELAGAFLKGDDVVQAFKYPVSGEVGVRTTFQFAFLRSVEPGTYKLRLNLVAPGGRDVGEAVIDLLVPEVGTQFSPDMAPTEASTLPAAEAIVIADEAERAAAGTGGEKLKILPPDREAPIGLLRLEADVQPPITKVEFYLEDKLIVRRTKAPYSVEIDLGEVPRKQTVRAVGYDSNGKMIDEDAWSINQGSARLSVKILPQTDPAAGNVKVKVAVQSIGGGVAKQVELFLDSKKIKTWTAAGPYEVTMPLNEYSKGEFLRATAIAEDGKEANDIRFLKGPNTTIESVRVDVVQLHVSALDKDNRFVKGLTETDFAVQEDGRAQTLTGFEIAEKLPADDRPRGGRVGLDGEVDALRARRVRRALPRHDPREGPGLHHRVPRAAPHDPGADGRHGGAPAGLARDLGARRDGAVRLGRARALPVPHAAGAQGAHRDHRRRRQPLARRLRHAAALLPLERGADLLHRGRPLGPRLRHPQGDQRDRPRVRRRGVPPLERREDRRRHQAHRGRAALPVHRRVPHGLAEAGWGVPRGAGEREQAGSDDADRSRGTSLSRRLPARRSRSLSLPRANLLPPFGRETIRARADGRCR